MSKQEKEPASEEIAEVAPGVVRMQLPIAFTGLGHVNCYALEDERGFAVVDPGLPGPDAWDGLLDRLRAGKVPLSRIHTVVITHSHPDHFGGAARLRAETGGRHPHPLVVQAVVGARRCLDDRPSDALDDPDQLVPSDAVRARSSSHPPTGPSASSRDEMRSSEHSAASDHAGHGR